jgi:hypothetical protein
MTVLLCWHTRWCRLSLVKSPRTCLLGILHPSLGTSSLVLTMITSPYLCGRLGFVKVQVFTSSHVRKSSTLFVNLIMTITVITFRRVSVNLQHFQRTNGSCIGSVCYYARLVTELKLTSQVYLVPLTWFWTWFRLNLRLCGSPSPSTFHKSPETRNLSSFVSCELYVLLILKVDRKRNCT